jgi:hypothetical protein
MRLQLVQRADLVQLWVTERAIYRFQHFSPRRIPMTDQNDELAGDVLQGAAPIAEFLFGDHKRRRKVYHLVATSNLPVFKLGAMLCARKSVLLKWIREQEERRAGLTVWHPAQGRIDAGDPAGVKRANPTRILPRSGD